MLDLVIRGATVVDGTGAPGRHSDVGVRDGRIVAVGSVDEPAAQSIDAAGLVLAPGFVDIHTHYDAQLHWDPTASPSNVHGVTTVIGGNCGFTLAPLHDIDADYTRRMMAQVEGMPIAALEQGVDWKWETFGQFLDALESKVAVNAGFLVGHCAIRRYVMGPDSVGGTASAEQLDEMVRVLHESIEAGGLGFSTGQSTHTDGDGQPVPSRHASRDEILALCAAVREHEGTTLEAIVRGCLDQFSGDDVDLLTAMSVAAQRPVNWNVLTVDGSAPQKAEHQLAAADAAAAQGGRIVALTMPVLVPMTMSLRTYCALNLIPGWSDVLTLPIPERIAQLRDPAVRARMSEQAQTKEAGAFRHLANFGRYVVGDTYSTANAGLKGRTIADIAAERGQDPFACAVEIAANDELRTILWPMSDDRPETWQARAQVWQDPRAMIGGSDAGAHLDRMCGATFPTRFLGDMLRGRKLLPLERAVKLITDDPARLMGLRHRGRIAEGWTADLVLFDPETVASADVSMVADLPGGAPRLTAGSVGMTGVWVNGVRTVEDSRPIGETPGTVLRSGRDTETVLP